MLVSSFFPGRVRLCAPIFKDDEICEKTLVILQASDAVKRGGRNPVAESILLLYDTKKSSDGQARFYAEIFYETCEESDSF